MSGPRKNKRRASGFTLVEVIVSMGVMVLGIMAVVALQSHTVNVNSFARQMSTASQIAQTWLERMKEDGHTWVLPGTDGVSPAAVLSQTRWLQQVNVAPGLFQGLPMAANTSGVFDFQGNELLAGSAGAPFFCTSFKPRWVYMGRAIRVDLRVFWPRERAGAVVDCTDTDAPLNPGGALFNLFHFYYLSTVINYVEAR